MIRDKIPELVKALPTIIASKSTILDEWLLSKTTNEVLSRHLIDAYLFKEKYASNVFEYFMAVIKGEMILGQCPVMNDLLEYFKDKDISADELFMICSQFRKAMIDVSYDSSINSKALFDDVSFLFDLNFSGLLKQYTDTIYQKEQEIERNVKLLNEYKRAIDTSAIVSKTDRYGVITYANDNLCNLCGYNRSELIGASHAIMRHPDMQDEFFSLLWSTIESQELFKGTIKNRKKNGDYFYIDITIVPIINPFSSEVEYMAIGYEVTSLVDSEQNALEANEAKDYFLSNMSHEIRTPLNAILGFVSLMQDDDVSKTHKKYLNIIHNSGASLLSIINDILDFSKLRQGEFTIDNRIFNLHEELSHTLELFVASANEKEITLLSYIDPNIPKELLSDPLRIKQIISNLISNAIKFTHSGGFVELEAYIRDATLHISIKDSGVGISSEKVEHIFDAFLQVQNSSTRDSGGTGLGLSICKKLANHMSGDVCVTSQLASGSIFTLSIPVEVLQDAQVLDYDTAPFKKLKLGFFNLTQDKSKEYYSLKRYLDAFEIALHVVNEIDEELYDILFFVDNQISNTIREKIFNQDALSIAIVNGMEERFDLYANITSLHLPIYCSKIYDVFLESLDLTPVKDEGIVQKRVQRKFKGHVLIAEDNVANQELIKTILTKYGLTYFIAADGYEAINIFKIASFDLILMDEQMPNVNGIEATENIIAYEKEQKQTHTPIVALSANVIKGLDKHTARAELFEACMGKPIDIRELELVLENYLEEKFDVTTAPLHVHHSDAEIFGIDTNRLKEELMLEDNELLMLVETFIKKMRTLLPELKSSIEVMELSEISRLAHSLKGSAANFRMDTLQALSKELEEASKEKKSDLNYMALYESIEEEFDKIYIQE